MDGVKISDVMTRHIVPAGVNDSLLDCARKMVRKKVGSLVITEGKELRGYISTHDILWALIKNPKADFSKIKAIDISPKKVITIKSSASIKEAIDKIKQFRFYRIPVVDKGEVNGIITLRDIITFYPGADSELKEIEMIREEAEKIRRLGRYGNETESDSEEGICEECGSQSKLYRINGSQSKLYRINDSLMCASCSNT